MQIRAKVCTGIISSATLFAIVAVFLSLMEPRYNGRTLSEWLSLYRSSAASQSEREQAAIAVRRIGRRGLDLVVRRAAGIPSFEGRVQNFVRTHKLPFLPNSVLIWANKPADFTRFNEARIGLIILGADAAPAIPELMRLALAHKVDTAWAMNSIGDMGRPGLDALITIMTNPASPLRAQAAVQFPKFGTNALIALPNLIQCLDGTDLRLRHACISAIGDLCLEPGLSVPALMKSLHAAEPTVRAYAASRFQRFGTNSIVALPSLVQALEDPDVQVQHACLTAIGDLHREPELCIPALIKCLTNSDPMSKEIAFEAIASFGPACVIALPEMKAFVNQQTDPFTKEMLSAVIHQLEQTNSTTLSPAHTAPSPKAFR